MFRAVSAAALLALTLRAADCPPSQLNPQETLARFQALDREAQAAFDGGRLPEAVRLYRETACLAPKSARAWFGLGGAEAAIGNYPAAQDAFERAGEILPENPMPLTMLLRVAVAVQDTEQIRSVLRQSAERFRSDTALHSGFARFLAEKQLFDLALAEALRAEASGDREAESAVTLAVLENTVGAYEDAAQKAVAVEGRADVAAAAKASAAGVAGLSFANLGRLEEAETHLRTATRLAPSQENSWLALGYLFEKAGRFKDAADVLLEARTHLPQSDAILLPLGNNLIWSEQFGDGIRVLDGLIAKAPKTEEAYIRLAEAYRKSGQPVSEVKVLNRLALIRRDYPMIHLLIAQAMLSMQTPDYPGILRELAAAEKQAPADADVHVLRGKTFLQLGRNTEAVASLNRAIELKPLDAAIYYQLGLAYRKSGQPQRAQETLARMNHLRQAGDSQ